jgi:large subunit ribosomal protein L24
MRIKKNDMVVVLTGRERNRRGKVLELQSNRERVLVDGVNMVKRHVKAGRDPKAPKGGIIEVAASIHISNVQLVCSKCNKPTKIGIKKLEDGKQVRFCKKCKEVLDK